MSLCRLSKRTRWNDLESRRKLGIIERVDLILIRPLLSRYLRGNFGERNVMAVQVRGGSLKISDKLNAKCEKLEKLRLSDRVVFEKMQQRVEKLEKEVDLAKKHAAKVSELEGKLAESQRLVLEAVKNQVAQGVASILEEYDLVKKPSLECQSLHERARRPSPCENAESLIMQSFSESEETAEEERPRKKTIKRSKKYMRTRAKFVGTGQHSLGSSVYGMLKSSLGFGLVLMFLLILGQIAFSSGGIVDCEARVVGLSSYYEVPAGIDGLLLGSNGLLFNDKEADEQKVYDECDHEGGGVNIVSCVTNIFEVLRNDVFLPKSIKPLNDAFLSDYDFDSGSSALEPGSSLDYFDRSVKSESNVKSLRLRKKKKKIEGGRKNKLENNEQKTTQKEEERKMKSRRRKEKQEENAKN
jgi:hypothetical protein